MHLAYSMALSDQTYCIQLSSYYIQFVQSIDFREYNTAQCNII